MECPHCKHTWLPRVSKPLRCPVCHNPLNSPPRPYYKKKEPSKHLPNYEESIIEQPKEINETIEPTEQEIEQSINEVKEKGEDFSFSK